jgi:hypothetical protein
MLHDSRLNLGMSGLLRGVSYLLLSGLLHKLVQLLKIDVSA